MCGVFGILSTRSITPGPFLTVNKMRGRDAWGYYAIVRGYRGVVERRESGAGPYIGQCGDLVLPPGSCIGNLRAEPTTERILSMEEADIQPYTVGDWTIVHNGTIANDKELCAKYGLTPPTRIDSWVIAALCDKIGFDDMLNAIVGSYAILAVNRKDPGALNYAVNYRPLYLSTAPDDTALTLSSVPITKYDTLIAPYSAGRYRFGASSFIHKSHSLYKARTPGRDKALVVLSGGLDSTVAAAELIRQGYEVELLHFDYGARATGPERAAVQAIAKHFNVPLHVITTDIFTSVIKGSRLTNTKDEQVAQGEAGAEYAHEWVPARNLIMVSIALGIAESRGFDVLALGANLEEAGAYPDNEPEFLNKVNQLIPFAVADGKRIRIETPVGNLMKHEIVKLGLENDAPMHLSWSCYDARAVHVPAPELMADGEQVTYRHCGKCGPCFMRKTAFEINGRKDPVFD